MYKKTVKCASYTSTCDKTVTQNIQYVENFPAFLI